MDAFCASTFSGISSFEPNTAGNLPALFKPGPNKRGIKRIKVEEAKKAEYEFANFSLIFYLFLIFLNHLES